MAKSHELVPLIRSSTFRRENVICAANNSTESLYVRNDSNLERRIVSFPRFKHAPLRAAAW